VRCGLVVDPARTWSSSHLSSEFDVIPGIEAFACAWRKFSFFNVCSVHRADILKVDILKLRQHDLPSMKWTGLYLRNRVCLKYGVLPGHDPRFEPRIIARWKQLFLSTVRSTADFDLVGGPFQVETARRIGIDVVENLDLDADCDEPFVSKM
jgi:hypothetical protein